jgi:hypothetical protein
LIRRFLLHVLQRGFMRVRHFGFLANSCRAGRLAEIPTALSGPPPEPSAPETTAARFDGYPWPQVPNRDAACVRGPRPRRVVQKDDERPPHALN